MKKALHCRLIAAFALGAGVGSLGFATPVVADITPVDAGLAHATELSDSALADLRGRFARGGQVSHFGLSFYSRWETEVGSTSAMAMEIDVGLPSGSTRDPRLQSTMSFYEHSASNIHETGSLPGDNTSSASANHAGLADVAGVVQVNQLTGDRNSSRNHLQLNVGSEGMPATPVAAMGLPVPLEETTSVTGESGVVATAVLEPNRVGISLADSQRGEIRQEISGGGISHILQHTAITADLNRINNVMNINWTLRMLDTPNVRSILPAINSVRGL